ncbi:hypothetical protein [Helicovermis profundi]|uniref:Flagellar protein n=1 Tax=Helicovermis profundi TaxID=3065157 RepID=A0AAU9E824_9FIRM|nr:hypothetical protein HLPR_26310 [Clostridia bacterium S502]
MNDYTCKRCGNLLLNGQKNYCTKCMEKNKVDLKIIREYLEKNKNATLMEISIATGISVKIINNLISNNSIEIVKDPYKL